MLARLALAMSYRPTKATFAGIFPHKMVLTHGFAGSGVVKKDPNASPSIIPKVDFA